MSKNLHKMSAAHLPALLMLILLALFPARLSAEVGDVFTYTYEGQTIKYIILSEEEKTVATNPGNFDKAGNEVLGALVLPSKVVNGYTEYTLVKIDDFSFISCTDLTSITIPESVTTIGELAFQTCKALSSITIPESVTTIGECALYNCVALTSVTIPNSITSIEYGTFMFCSALSSITIPESVTVIGETAFAFCEALTSITIPESVTTIGKSAFVSSGLSSITIPESVTTIGKNTFMYCRDLSSITIPESVTDIGESAFEECEALSSITIPNSITTIGYRAFTGCKKLKDFYSWAINPPANSGSFFEIDQSIITLHVPAESVAAYSKAEVWKEFGKILGDVESAGIEGIEADGSNAPAEYFNLNGVRVDNPENGLYIKRQGGKSTKVLVK